MKIDVASIRKAPGESGHFEFRKEIQPFEIGGSEVSFAEPATVTLDITNTGVSLQVAGEITGELQFNCSRCLEPFRYHLDTGFEEQYRHVTQIAEDGDDNRSYQIYEDDIIDFTDAVMEHLILGLPMKPVCSQECQGICPQCGTNKNISKCLCKDDDIDPRFAALKDYFNRS